MTWYDGDAHGLECVGHSDLGGHGDGMQVMRHGDVLYVGHVGTTGAGTSILDVRDPTGPELLRQWPITPGTHSHKVQVADGLLVTNSERFQNGDEWVAGMAVHDLTDPVDPKRIGWFDSGGNGIHRIVWTGGRYVYASGKLEGHRDRIFVIIDLADPAAPVEAGRWWWPGSWEAGGEVADWPAERRPGAHHALLDGDIAYLGYGDHGLVVLDLSDRASPREIGRCSWRPGGRTHTCLPLGTRGLVAVTDEATRNNCEEELKLIRLVDVADPTDPRVVGSCPVPEGPFCERGMRFGPHNLHENRAQSYRSDSLIFATYFNAGLRVYDVADPTRPVEVASWCPDAPPGQEAPQANDVFVDEDLTIWVTDRIGGGLCALRPTTDLERLMRERAS